MQLMEALEIFKIKDIDSLDEAFIKKRFRELMRKHHPDVGGNDEVAKNINCAYSVLLESWKSLKAFSAMPRKREERIYLIPFDKLVDIYNGHSIKVSGSGGEYELNKKNLRSNKVILSTEVSVVYKGEVHNFNNLQLVNAGDNYSIYCTLYDEDISSSESLIIRAYNKEVRVNMAGKQLKVLLNFDDWVKLSVNIDRVEKVGGEVV